MQKFWANIRKHSCEILYEPKSEILNMNSYDFIEIQQIKASLAIKGRHYMFLLSKYFS